ncbi:MAG: patatin-like phospholipase family protein [Verrucomicrobiota bacterium]
MFGNFFHTSTSRRKLPVPFYEVLDQEQTALRGTESTQFTCDFTAEHLAGTAGLLERLQPLLPAEQQNTLPASPTAEWFVSRLNELLNLGTCLYQHRHFPRATLRRETVAMTRIELDASELRRLNRQLLEEAFPEHLKKLADLHLSAIYRRIHEGSGSVALCFSGGGIRSATFALGVTQGLARQGLLPHFDYISTVSGGGYIGSWLSSWIHRAGGIHAVSEKLKGIQAGAVTQPEPPPLAHLRKYSNYLTPKLGWFSADSWVLAATYLRNLILNWLLIGPLLLALLCIPRLHVSLVNLQGGDVATTAVFLAGFLLATVGMAFSTLNRPAVAEDLEANCLSWYRRRDQQHFLLWCFLPLCASAFCVTTAWSWTQSGHDIETTNRWLRTFLEVIRGEGTAGPKLLHYGLMGALLHLSGWLLAELCLQRWRKGKWRRLFTELALMLTTGALGGAFLWNAATLYTPTSSSLWLPSLYSSFGAPAILLLFLLAATVFIGVSSRFTSDDDREWWSRMGAWLLIGIVGWGLFSAIVLIGPVGLLLLPKKSATILGAIGGVSGLFTLIVGHAGFSAATKDGKTRDGKLAGLSNQALALAAPLALATLVAALSLVTSWLLIGTVSRVVTQVELVRPGWSELHPRIAHLASLHPFTDYQSVINDAPVWMTLGFLLITALISWSLAHVININKFSLHSIYRNRLVRAYLGASNTERKPNPFTGLDPKDNLPLPELRDPKDSSLPQRPVHIVNMALNLVSGENLAWQQRKAESFTASTLHCGNYRLGYRFTKHYALNLRKEGLSLGTALSISGAAASPNQGYHSSPLVALLMTLFNVRLGWWLGNPGALGYESFHHSAPHSPLRHLLKEGLGLTDSTSPYVYLSDGGHFENLGLYEMILRRVRVIVLSDAGCDPTCNLEDLGNAIRKIRVDLGVKISFDKFDIYSRTDEAGKTLGKYCAVGEIDYSAVDPGGRKGTLIYLKPALLGKESRDIFNYASACSEFPHEPTSDQWFSESQFESYRALGSRVIEWIYAWRASTLPTPEGREELFKDFIKQAYTATETPPAAHIGDLFQRRPAP